MNNYFNTKKNSHIDLLKEACEIGLWNNDNLNIYSCCKHPNGFYIFLTPDEIKSSDEYREDDPYNVNENLKSPFQQRRINCTIELIKNYDGSKGNIKLLDLGCGQGHFTYQIKKQFDHYEVYALDYSLSAIEYANSNFKEIDFIVANAYAPPYKNAYFDIVVCNNLWEHVPDPLSLLQSINRILKPNGLLIISTPSRYRLVNLVQVCLGRNISFMSDLHVTEYSVGQIKEQLKFGGYKLKKIFSPPIKEKGIILSIIKYLLSLIIKILKSHHILESTVFYSAVKLKS